MTIHKTHTINNPITSDVLSNKFFHCDTRPEGEHDDLLVVYDYWKSKHQENGDLPKLSAIELMDIWRIAKNIFIVDLVVSPEGHNRFLFRYYGTSVIIFTGMELTGKYIDEVLLADSLRETTIAYTDTLNSGIPHIWKRSYEFIEDSPRRNQFTRLLVPLLDHNGKPGHLLGVMHMT